MCSEACYNGDNLLFTDAQIFEKIRQIIYDRDVSVLGKEILRYLNLNDHDIFKVIREVQLLLKYPMFDFSISEETLCPVCLKNFDVSIRTFIKLPCLNAAHGICSSCYNHFDGHIRCPIDLQEYDNLVDVCIFLNPYLTERNYCSKHKTYRFQVGKICLLCKNGYSIEGGLTSQKFYEKAIKDGLLYCDNHKNPSN